MCEQTLRTVSRVPVCSSCLSLPQPLAAEFSCRLCQTPFNSAYPLDANDLCATCRESRINFDAAYSFGNFEGALQRLIHVFKYGRVESLAGPLSALLLRALPFHRNFDCVMAVPMHWRKKWTRGFNQAELLAQPVAQRYGLKLSQNLIRKSRSSAQASLDERSREKNLQGAFVVRKPEQIKGKRILLVDDVFTTGATLRAAATALKSAGAIHVSVLTLARVDRRLCQTKIKRQMNHRLTNDQQPIARAS